MSSYSSVAVVNNAVHCKNLLDASVMMLHASTTFPIRRYATAVLLRTIISFIVVIAVLFVFLCLSFLYVSVLLLRECFATILKKNASEVFYFVRFTSHTGKNTLVTHW